LLLPQVYSLEGLVNPQLFLKFSHNAVIAPYGDIGLMIRLTPYKNTNFTDAEAKITGDEY
jgi:hypothetical protein